MNCKVCAIFSIVCEFRACNGVDEKGHCSELGTEIGSIYGNGCGCVAIYRDILYDA